jgi:DNA-binding transcriptional ArsR family regulator
MSLTTDQLSEMFAALGDPIRLAIVARLARSDATVQELAEPFSVSLPAISRHLKVLERAGLIARGRAAQSRPSSLRVKALKEAITWMNARREMWEGRMDRLDRHLTQIQRVPEHE